MSRRWWPALAMAFLALPAVADFQPSNWRWSREVVLPGTPGKYAAVAIDPVTFGHAQPGLRDLRVVGPDGVELPWALVVRRGRTAVTAFQPEILNRSVTAGAAADAGGEGVSLVVVEQGGVATILRPTISERQVKKDGAQELVLDLGRPGIRHSRIRLEIDGGNYRREVNLYGSDDGAAWKRIAQGLDIFDLSGDHARVSRRTLDYPPSIHRYLKLEIPLGGEAPLAVRSAEIEMVEREEAVMREVAATRIEPRPQPNGRFSDFAVSFGADNVPVEGLTLAVADPEFYREVEVWDRGFQRRLGGGVIYRYDLEGRVRQNLEVQVGGLLGDFGLRVINGDDRPLKIEGITADTILRTLVFRAPASGPVRLFLGNPSAAAPVYDLTRYLPRSEAEATALATLGELKANPDYAPPKKPRDWGFLIWVALAPAVLALAFLIYRSARQINGPTA